MLDSTYLVASDPNSMRDMGPCRNSEYNIGPAMAMGSMTGFTNTMQSENSVYSPQKTRDQFIKSKGNRGIQSMIDYKNKAVYSYGGKTKIMDKKNGKIIKGSLGDYTSQYSPTKNRWSKSIDMVPHTINREFNHRVNDYSKNVSQTIFCPGHIDQSVKSRATKTPGYAKRRLGKQRRSIGLAQDVKNFHPQRPNAMQLKKEDKRNKSSRPKTTNKSNRSAKSISRQIQRERK